MNDLYIIKAKKIITVSSLGTIEKGAMVIENGRIIDISNWEQIQSKYTSLDIVNVEEKIITPSLIDCHTHFLEFAPSSVYPVTSETHFLAAKSILLHALSSGITAVGEQICGHPVCDFSIEEYRNIGKDIPLHISFASTSITIGLPSSVHFTAITRSQPVNKEILINPRIIEKLADNSDYPGENIFINATPANFTTEQVPNAGEIVYSQEELNKIANIYHQKGKQIGAHVAGERGIEMALQADIDVLHHAHGITEKLIDSVSKKGTKIVATPLGGTHLKPNSPDEIVQLIRAGIPVSIATDGYLPPYPNTDWLPYKRNQLYGPEILLEIAAPAMKKLKQLSFNENDILALLTINPAKILGKEKQIGSLEIGKDADFLVSNQIPGLEFTDINKIESVFYQGKHVIQR